MSGEFTMEEIEALTKRFKDYIDKVQVALDKAENVKPKKVPSLKSEKSKADILYTVVSPTDAMADNIQSVLNVIDNAINHIDKMDPASGDDVSMNNRENVKISASSNEKIFTTEELEFLQSTYSKILNRSDEERSRIFKNLVNETKL